MDFFQSMVMGFQVALQPGNLFFCFIGVYSINNSLFDVGTMLAFGVVGYLMKKFKYEGAPLILAFVLSPLMENALRQSLIMSHGRFAIFFTRPIAVTFVLIALFLLISPIIPGFKKRPKGGDIV